MYYAEFSAGGIRKIYVGASAPKAANPHEYRNDERSVPDWPDEEEYYEDPSEELDAYDEPTYDDFAEYDDEAVSRELEHFDEEPEYQDSEQFHDSSDELNFNELEAAYYHEEEVYIESGNSFGGDYEDSDDELLIRIQALSVQYGEY